MILIGLIEILYSVGYGAVQAFGADFALPPSTTEVISYSTNMLSNGKAIINLFLDLPYIYFLVQMVFTLWAVLLLVELISWIFRLVKFKF